MPGQERHPVAKALTAFTAWRNIATIMGKNDDMLTEHYRIVKITLSTQMHINMSNEIRETLMCEQAQMCETTFTAPTCRS